jgi:hypothetical protein
MPVLRDVLDEATQQLARETYGRRRETTLQLAVVGREDQLTEVLRRWVRRAQETCANEDLPITQRLNTIVRDAYELLRLEFVDGAASHRDIALVPRIGSVAGILLRDVARTLVDDCRSRRRDRCNWSGRWATLTWTMMAVRPRPFLLLKPPGRLCDVRPPNCHYRMKHEQEPPPLSQLQHQ